MTMPQAWIFAQLVEARASLHDVTRETWNQCLLSIMETVRRLSPLESGETQYLHSVSRSVA
jgi:hypothetical protein